MKRQKMRRVIKILITLVCFSMLIITVGCGSATPSVEKSAEKNGGGNEYISFTVTNEVPGELFESHVFCYNISDGKLSEKTVVPYNSQYPLAVYDRSTEKVFYSASAEKGARLHTGDQLYSFDINTKKTEKLTDSLYAINYIIPYDDSVLLVACPKDIEKQLTLLLYSWNKTDRHLSELSWDSDASITQAYMRPGTGELTIATIPSAEDWERIGNQSAGNPYIPPETSVFNVGLEGAQPHHELLFKQKQEVEMLLCIGSELLLKEKSYIKDGYALLTPKRLLIRDASGNDEGDWKHEGKLGGLKSLVYITDDGKLYYIAFGEGDADTELRKYDTKSGETEVIYAAKKGYSAINNAVALKG